MENKPKFKVGDMITYVSYFGSHKYAVIQKIELCLIGCHQEFKYFGNWLRSIEEAKIESKGRCGAWGFMNDINRLTLIKTTPNWREILCSK